MKKLTVVLAVLGIILISCREQKPAEETPVVDSIEIKQTPADALKTDTVVVDSVTNK
jgi:hypothetical protein